MKWILKFHAALLGALLAIVGNIVAAAEPAASETVDLARAVQAAWQRAALAREAEGELLRTDAGRRIAHSLAADAPSLEYARTEGDWYGGARAGSGREVEAGINWPLWLPGQRRAAIQAARADSGWAQSNLDLSRLEVARQVREAVWEVASAQAMLHLAGARVEFMRTLAADVARRVDAGELAYSDDLAAQADLMAAQGELADAGRSVQDSHARWKVLTGLEALPDVGEVERESAEQLEALIEGAGIAPPVRAAELALQRAGAEHQAVRRSLGAPPELSLGSKEERAAPGAPPERSVTLALRIPLGLGARRTRARVQAQTALEVAEAELVLARSQYAQDLHSARTALQLAREQRAREQRRAALLGERLGLMRQAFAAGEIDLNALLLATRLSAEADAELARRQAGYGLAHARLLHTIGVLP